MQTLTNLKFVCVASPEFARSASGSAMKNALNAIYLIYTDYGIYI